MRLFISVNPPQDVLEECKRVQALPFPAQTSKPKTFHISLKFLGETQPATAEKVQQALEQIHVTPFEAMLDKLGVFPSPMQPRVLWLGLQPHEKFKQLQKAIDTALKPWFQPDKRFHPHITLARIKTLTSKQAFQKFLTKTTVKPLKFEIGSFALMESKLSPKGAQHTKKAEYS